MIIQFPFFPFSFFLLVGIKFFWLSYGVYGVTQLKWIVAICRDLLGLGFATYPTVYDMPGIKQTEVVSGGFPLEIGLRLKRF